jgi:hypothetical protein
VVVSLPGPDLLRQEFNDRRADLRVVSLVSPSCDQCLDGLKLVLDTVSGGGQDVTVFVLWLNIIEGDGPQAAARRAGEYGVPRSVRHYWEGDGWPVSSRARAVVGIGEYDPTQSAWDVHLLYRRGVEWDGDLPSPTAWAYNNTDDFCVGERLNAAVIQGWLD